MYCPQRGRNQRERGTENTNKKREREGDREGRCGARDLGKLQLSGVERGCHENIVTASRSPLCREEDDSNDVGVGRP